MKHQALFLRKIKVKIIKEFSTGIFLGSLRVKMRLLLVSIFCRVYKFIFLSHSTSILDDSIDILIYMLSWF